jgi:hypothetical protein
MTDPELQAAMQVLSVLTPPAYFTDLHLFCLHLCRMVNISMQHGTSGASDTMGTVAFWTQPIATAIDLMRETFRTATETGNLTYGCWGMFRFVTGLLLRNDPLDVVWRESEMALDFARQVKYRDIATCSAFSDADFDEAALGAQLTTDRMPIKVCFYWILKLQAQFLAGDYADALVSADKAKALLWASAVQIQLLDYLYYAALTVAACYDNGSADEQQAWRELLTGHREQLREWAENYAPTFADKHALVSAEIARIEKRDADAMRLYEDAIHLAREHGFVQSEALAYEVAARFYLARGFEKIGHLYLRSARFSYDRWGALGKVKQLDALYPRLESRICGRRNRRDRSKASGKGTAPPRSRVARSAAIEPDR